MDKYTLTTIGLEYIRQTLGTSDDLALDGHDNVVLVALPLEFVLVHLLEAGPCDLRRLRRAARALQIDPKEILPALMSHLGLGHIATGTDDRARRQYRKEAKDLPVVGCSDLQAVDAILRNRYPTVYTWAESGAPGETIETSKLLEECHRLMMEAGIGPGWTRQTIQTKLVAHGVRAVNADNRRPNEALRYPRARALATLRKLIAEEAEKR